MDGILLSSLKKDSKLDYSCYSTYHPIIMKIPLAPNH